MVVFLKFHARNNKAEILSTYRNICDVIAAYVKHSYLRAAADFPVFNLGQMVVIKS